MGNWGVVGGGMLGLSVARALRKRGHAVTVLEGAEAIGGLVSAWRLGEVTWDRHYHVILQSDAYLLSLLADLGLEDELRWVQTRAGYFVDGELRSISNALELLRFPALSLVGKLRFGGTIFWGSKVRNWRALEQMPVERWLRRWSGDRAFERMWLPLLRSKLGEAYQDTSAAFIWATIQRLYAARRSGNKAETFGYVRGGYARVLERLAERLGDEDVEVRTGVRVERVEPGPEGVRVALQGGEVEKFDQVVMTLAAPLAARLCGGLTDDERARLEGVRYLGIVCASLLLRRPLAGYYVTNLLDEGFPFTGVIEMSALVDREEQLAGHSLVYLPRYVESKDPFLRASDEEVQKVFWDGLRRIHSDLEPADLECFRISRVPHVMALPTLGYSTRVPPMRTESERIHLVSSAHILNGTLNVNETLQVGQRFLDQLPEAT